MAGIASRIAIVGFGPRGLGALEALIRVTRDERAELRIDIFDPADFPGAGPNFSPAEDQLCLLNLPVRDIDLPQPVLPPNLPTFRDWLTGADAEADHFPPRAILGAYLSERFARLREAIEPEVIVTHHRKLVSGIERDERGWLLQAGDYLAGPYDEVLLSLGQPRTKPDGQLASWRRHAEKTGAVLVPAYPGRDLVAAARGWSRKSVGVRGMGLSTLDVVRLLTLGLGGKFSKGRYVPSGREPRRIVPFSLDGIAPAPKPATGALDRNYDLADEEHASVRAALDHALTRGPDASVREVSAALVAPARRILNQMGSGATEAEIADWLDIERNGPGEQEDLDGLAALRRDSSIAHGRAVPTIGYAIGQIWRKSQAALRAAFDQVRVAPDTAAAIVSFDEGLKRYSYGPPVETADQLIQMVEAGIVVLKAAADPDILETSAGWRVVSGESHIDVDVMVDAVLSPARLELTEDPALRSLLKAERIAPVQGELGARVLSDGALPMADGLSLLGRMSTGSVIGTDSIHDCFGAPARRWAEGVVDRAWQRARTAGWTGALKTAI